MQHFHSTKLLIGTDLPFLPHITITEQLTMKTIRCLQFGFYFLYYFNSISTLSFNSPTYHKEIRFVHGLNMNEVLMNSLKPLCPKDAFSTSLTFHINLYDAWASVQFIMCSLPFPIFCHSWQRKRYWQFLKFLLVNKNVRVRKSE